MSTIFDLIRDHLAALGEEPSGQEIVALLSRLNYDVPPHSGSVRVTETKVRTPDQILTDLDEMVGDDADRSLMVHGLVWEIIEDVRSSYRLAIRLAMREGKIATADGEEIEETVSDYLANHWGDD